LRLSLEHRARPAQDRIAASPAPSTIRRPGIPLPRPSVSRARC